jgi:nitrate/TMAO reductase-like tetraheme cytochrome c subunit
MFSCSSTDTPRGPTRALASVLALALAAVGLLLTTAVSADASDVAAQTVAKQDGLLKDDSQACMRCHWMETMAYRDRETGEIVDLSIDSDAYRHSVHAELACSDCHARGYGRYPHRTSSADENLQCVECHEAHQDEGAPNLIGVQHEYEKSVHAVEKGDDFSCFACHNPHDFKPAAAGKSIAEVVAQTNGTCLSCHKGLLTPVPKGHEWLPKPQAHWSSVRCLDCHTPLEGRIPERPSHHVLAAADSNQLCVECHRKGSELLSQLYNYRAEQEREQQGFFSQALYNDAYIVGMSRNAWLDGISLAIIALMILGVDAHGIGRYLAYRKRESSQ